MMNYLLSILCFYTVADAFHQPAVNHHKRSNELAPICMSSKPTETTSIPINRRQILSSIPFIAAVTASSQIPRLNTPNIFESATPITDPTVPQTTTLSSLNEALQTISSSCDRRYLHAVVASDYKFMYRGLPANEKSSTLPSIQSEPSDLLLPSTYGSIEAADFFAALEEQMQSQPVKPSNGHLAVTNVDAAKVWGGEAASIWPLLGGEGENSVHFAWLEDGGEFWSDQKKRNRDDASNMKVIVDGVDCGRFSLEDALEGDNVEILFRADRFLMVPVSMEEELLQGLKSSFLI